MSGTGQDQGCQRIQKDVCSPPEEQSDQDYSGDTCNRRQYAIAGASNGGNQWQAGSWNHA